jgi:aminoglycoside phosphotransferase (APT) family kinase protein
VAVAPSWTDEAELTLAIERSFGTGASTVRSRPVGDGSYDSRILTIRSSKGKETRLFLKNFGALRGVKSGVDRRAAAEIGIYRHLLSRMDLGTARYYGSGPANARRTWLLLEFVEGRELADTTFDAWEAAARWLARLQAEVRARGLLAESGFLPPLDRTFFTTEAERALQTAAGWSAECAQELEAALRHYRPAIDEMAGQPPTLVHGKYRNILVARPGARLRICPLDWEPGAVGPALYDLAFLVEGLPEPQVERLVRAYVERGAELRLPREDMEMLDCFRLHRALGLVRKAAKRTRTLAGVAAAVRRVTELAARVGVRS